MIELQRACSRIAYGLRDRFPESLWCNIEADISPELVRLVIHYGDNAHRRDEKLMNTVELDLHPGHPVDDGKWISGLVDSILELVHRNESDLIIPQPFDYTRLCDSSGQTIFEEGKAMEFKKK
jgi:hypothetical protein